MAQKKFDGVVEAAHFAPDGRVELVRMYERRGPAFSDRVLLTRQELVDLLKAKKRILVGRRTPYLGGMFEVGAQLQLVSSGDGERVVTGNQTGERDFLEGVPLF